MTYFQDDTIESLADNPLTAELEKERPPLNTAFSPKQVQDIWSKTLEILAKKLRKPSFQTWVRPCQLVAIADNHATIAVKNEFTRNFLSQSYEDKIMLALKEASAISLGLRFIIDSELCSESHEDNEQKSLASLSDADTSAHQISVSAAKGESLARRTDLAASQQLALSEVDNADQLFQAYIHAKTGVKDNLNFASYFTASFNKTGLALAHALVNSILTETQYQVLLINAASGLGKTHLLHAIANKVLAQNSSLKVRYVSAENFTNEFITSIRTKTTHEFRKKYRQLDLLLFDNLEFLESKNSVQEELTHTYIDLINRGKHLVFSANRELRTLNLADNLKSYLDTAILAEISTPSFESRLAILRQMAIEGSIDLAEEQLSTVAQRCTKSIRELEGAVLRLSAYTSFTDEELDNSCIAKLFGYVHRAEHQGLSLEKISGEVAEYFGIKLKELVGKRRLVDFTRPRHLAIYLAYDLLKISYSRIGEYFSGRKHSSIIHSIKLVKNDLAKDRSLALIIDDIKSKLLG